jgi:DNA-directed RNA polymerase specialized sigma24 family protein
VTINSELGGRIDAAIDVLLEDLKVAVILRYVQSLSNQEAADTLDVSLSALKARLHGGRIALRYSLRYYVVERAKVD